MVVPGAVRGEDEIAVVRRDALALDDGVAAFFGQDGAARIGRMQMHRRHIAGIVDRDGAADGVGHLQAAVQSGIEQKNALPVGELDRRYIGLGGDLRDLLEVAVIFVPLPHMRQRFHLIDGDAAGAELAGTFARGFAEPRLLRRRVRLGADPDIMLAGVGVDGLHQFARFVGQSARGRGLHCHRGHDVFSVRGGTSASHADICSTYKRFVRCLQRRRADVTRCVLPPKKHSRARAPGAQRYQWRMVSSEYSPPP